MQELRKGPERARATSMAQKFVAIGAIGVLINTTVLTIVYHLLHLPLLLASVIAVECSLVSDYFLNDRLIFHRRRPSWRLFVKFNLATSVVLSTTPSVVWLLVHSGLHFLAANLIGIAAGTGLNFASTTLWVWGFSKGGIRACSTSSSPRSSSSPSL